MLIAHLPSGYLLARGTASAGRTMAAMLVGSVFPDIDMLRFHLIDHGRVHHHAYFTHLPVFWAACALLALPLARGKPLFAPMAGFLTAVGLHLMLDTLAGDILWGWPFSNRFFHLVTVPPRHGSWILSFALHWTFLLEVAITLTAAALILWRKKA